MAGVVDESEELITLLLICGILGLLIWGIFKLKDLGVNSPSDFGNWLKNLFGFGQGTEWLSPEGSGIPSQPLPPPTPEQIANVQQGMQQYQQFANSQEPWQEQVFDWFSSQFTGQGTGQPQVDQELQPW